VLLTIVTVEDIIGPMLKKDAINHFGSLSELARALGIQKSAISRWHKWVPLKRAMQLEAMSKGELRCNIDAYLAQK
jgi:hypothetical protein